MTVQDFIVNYSATFEFIHQRYGKKAVIDLWDYLDTNAIELRDIIKEKGLDGYYEYFYGSNGTCVREDLVGGAYIKDGVLTEIVEGCPSVGELEARGKKPYRYFCEHCYWVYRKCVEDNGLHFDIDFQLQPGVGTYCKSCKLYVREKEETV